MPPLRENQLMYIPVAPVACLSKDCLAARIVAAGRKGYRDVTGIAVDAPAGERTGYLNNVVLGVAIAFTHGKQLHQLAGVVLVGLPHYIDVAVEVDQHGGIEPHLCHEGTEVAQTAAVQQVVIRPFERGTVIDHLFRGKMAVPKNSQLSPGVAAVDVTEPAPGKRLLVLKIQIGIVAVIAPLPGGPLGWFRRTQ